MQSENVLVIPRELFDRLGAFQGIRFDVENYLPAFMDSRNNFFMPRPEAENDPTHKQVIPYNLLTHGGRVLRYRRGKKSGEQRLALKGSIGIGGHINEEDQEGHLFTQAGYLNAVERELEEEVIIPRPLSNRPVALINDDSNDVGRVHLGVIHVVQLPAPAAQSNEKHVTDAAFLTLEELRSEYSALEGWSQICVDHLERILAS